MDREDVVNHFKVLIELWESENASSVNDEQFQKSVSSIYNYFNTEFLRTSATEDDRRWLRNQLSEYKTLWGYGEFWKPEHTFQRDYPCFGKRRQRLAPEPPIREVFELLGQRKQPELEDYIAFLDQLGKESRGEALDDEDAKCAYGVLKRLTIELGQVEAAAADYDLLLLTDDRLLLPPEGILVPDAPWHVEAIQGRSQVKILHPEVPHSLAIAAGCRSFLESVVEQPEMIQPASDTKARSRCQKWQTLVRSPEFIHGLERLIVHQRGDAPPLELHWLTITKVTPAAEIKTDLLLDKQVIASGLRGNHYFNAESNTVYVSCEDGELMRHYLVESLNHRLNQLTRFKLNDTGPLMTIINASPEDVARLLNRLKIKVLDRPEMELPPLDGVADTPDQIFDSSIVEDDEQETDFAEAETEPDQTEEITSATRPTSSEATSPTVSRPEAGTAASNGGTSATTTSETDETGGLTDAVEVSIGTEEPASDIPKPVIKPARPSESDDAHPGNRQLPSERGGLAGLTPNSGTETESDSEPEQDQKPYRVSPAGRVGPSRNRVVKFKPRGKSGRSRRPGQRRSGSTNRSKRRIYPSQQYRNGVRVRSGLEHDPEQDAAKPTETEANKIDRAGMEQVMAYERSHGRQPQDMNEVAPNHQGYDIESKDPKTGKVRYIEVKSLRDKWGKRGVCMSSAQFKEGNHRQDDYWLYVVEFAETEYPTVFPIQNPVGLVGEFYYDGSWRQLAGEEEE